MSEIKKIKWFYGLGGAQEGSRSYQAVQAVGRVLCRRYSAGDKRGAQVLGRIAVGPRIEIEGNDTDGLTYVCYITVRNVVDQFTGTRKAYRRVSEMLGICKKVPLIGHLVKRITFQRMAVGYVDFPPEERDEVRKQVSAGLGIRSEDVRFIGQDDF